jgi:hypothetical protein
MHQQKIECNNIGDIFWASSFTKKKVYELFEGAGIDLLQSKQRLANWWASRRLGEHSLTDYLLAFGERTTIFDAHTTLGTQLEDSGLVEESMRHFNLARVFSPDPSDASLLLRNSLMVPVLYDSLQHLIESRETLEANVDLLLQSELSLKSLNQLSMVGTFYIIYQGFNDSELLTKIRNAYYKVYPKMATAPL